MASDLVHDPVRRQRYRFERAGDVLRVEVWIDPGGEVPEHLHPGQEERFEVRSGLVRFTVDGVKRDAGPGGRLAAPPGSRHRFENVSPEEASMRVEVEPALDLQGFLEDAARLARERKYTRRGLPRGPRAALELAVFAERYRKTSVLTSPMVAAQRPLLPLLARIGRRLGYGSPGA
jgi:quercetin dioxygenase-like cupin family protein